MCSGVPRDHGEEFNVGVPVTLSNDQKLKGAQRAAPCTGSQIDRFREARPRGYLQNPNVGHLFRCGPKDPLPEGNLMPGEELSSVKLSLVGDAHVQLLDAQPRG